MADFNPRSREGSDHQILDLVLDINISIHAPARGATLIGTIGKSLRLISIHAPARGATPLACYVRFSNRNFNPRSREGSDEGGGCMIPGYDISIHAPARGATAKLHTFAIFFQGIM